MGSNSILVSGGTPHGLIEAGADLVQGNVATFLSCSGASSYVSDVDLKKMMVKGREVELILPHHYLYGTLDYDQDQVRELLRIKL